MVNGSVLLSFSPRITRAALPRSPTLSMNLTVIGTVCDCGSLSGVSSDEKAAWTCSSTTASALALSHLNCDCCPAALAARSTDKTEAKMKRLTPKTVHRTDAQGDS